MSDDYDTYRGGDPGADPADEWDRPAKPVEWKLPENPFDAEAWKNVAPVLTIVRDDEVEAAVDRHPAGQTLSTAERYEDAIAEIKTLAYDRMYFGSSPLSSAVLAVLAKHGL